MDVNRSIQFVSLDTHPANNALVVTYEISVSVILDNNGSSKGGRELARRNKRHQIQVQLSALDKLTRQDLEADQLALDLGELSAEIVNKCPLLKQNRNNAMEEDIKLHLLYLIGRRRTQLLSETIPRVGSGQVRGDRPPSALSSRLRPSSSAAGQRLIGSARRRQSASISSTSANRDLLNSNSSSNDVYTYLLNSEENSQSFDSLFLNQTFMDQLDEHLSMMENSNTQLRDKLSQDSQQDLESQLEGLYGDFEEKLVSMAGIRQKLTGDKYLVEIASNRLLICALLRTLRDSDQVRDQQLRESILYCLLWFTSYQDVYSLTPFASDKDPIELERIVVELLIDHISTLTRCSKQQQQQGDNKEYKSIEEGYYYLNSLLILTINLLQMANDSERKFLVIIIQQQQQNQEKMQNFVSSLLDLLQLLAKHLTRGIRLMSKLDKCLFSLHNLICILRHLSIFKDFVCQLRAQTQFVDSIINLLSTLQLSRPGSGQQQQQVANNNQQQQQQQQLVTDKQTLKQVYKLEMDLLKLVNNLIFDPKLKLKFIRRNLLKCVLRNVVVLLANNRQFINTTTLIPFHKSAVLMVPFKCLYELSCHELVKNELFKSKIIIKCLLEFLLSSTMDLKTSLETSVAASMLSNGRRSLPPYLPASSEEVKLQKQQQPVDYDHQQIVLEPNCAAHYIISLWANLSSQSEATIYKQDPELLALVGEYINLTLCNLRTFLASFTCSKSSVDVKRISKTTNHHDELMIYLHSKVLRNMSQYLNGPEVVLGSLAHSEWIQQMVLNLNTHLQSAQDFLKPISVECLAILSNLISKNPNPTGEGDCSALSVLIERLFQLDFKEDFEGGENDDLLLVLILLLANVAKNREICGQQENGQNQLMTSAISMKIIEASNFILCHESRPTTDHEMIISTLYALNQLMSHSSFLRQLSNYLPTTREEEEEKEKEATISAIQLAVVRLVDRLAELVLHVNLMVSRLSILLLNNLRQLEQQFSLESLVYKRRFSLYHQKWLSAIQATGDLSAAPSASDPLKQQVRHKTTPNHYLLDTDDDDDDDDYYLNVDDPNQVRALDSDSQVESLSAAGSAGRTEQEMEADSSDDDSLEAPDLNVIDSNSMIKHLTSRREFRSKWLDNRR